MLISLGELLVDSHLRKSSNFDKTPSETVGFFFVVFDDTNIEKLFGFHNVLTNKKKK